MARTSARWSRAAGRRAGRPAGHDIPDLGVFGLDRSVKWRANDLILKRNFGGDELRALALKVCANLVALTQQTV